MKNGFTLVELLAVIIILSAIIAIVMPLVNDSVDKSIRSTQEDNIELYASAVKNAVLAYELENKKSPIHFDDIEEFIDFDKAKVECDVKIVNTDGSVFLTDCYVNDELVKGYETGTTPKICNLKEEFSSMGKISIGDKYECEVKEGTTYDFYVLSIDGSKINLMMDKGICENGDTHCLYSYNSTTINGDVTGEGPITAMAKLENSTKDWINIPNINETYDDEGGHFEDFVLKGKARLPYYSEVSAINNSTNTWFKSDSEGCYYTLSTDSSSATSVRMVLAGTITTESSSYAICGVRPVITLYKNNFE